MKFLVDHQLPLQLVKYLRRRGHECTHVMDVGLDKATDHDLWEHCRRNNLVLISKDEDFVYLSSRQVDAVQLLWVRLGNCRNEELIKAFERVHDRLAAAFESGQVVVEIR